MATYTILAEGGRQLTADPLDIHLLDLHLASSPVV
jgi:hypothetical protein